MKRIILTGGGTAGHVTPNLALVPRLQAAGWEVHYVGTENGIERRLVEQTPGVQYHAVASGKLRRYFDLKNFTDPFRVIKGAAQAAALVHKLRPDVVFSKGGFVSVPVVYGAHLNRVPVVIHESDMTPGLANRLSTPFAKIVLCAFPETAEHAGRKARYSGLPIRPEIFSGSREEGLRLFGFQPDMPVLMVVGGSSGAVAINKAVREALPRLTESFQVLHVCGAGHLSEPHEGAKNYCQREYLNDELPHAYQMADVIVSRAGANALCEILALRKPALLIPYPKAASRGDQLANAAAFEKRGLCRVLLQENLSAETLSQQVVDVHRDRGMLIERMEHEALPNGLENAINAIEEAAKKKHNC